MEQEIEVKFLDVDHDEARAKLKKLGGKLRQPMRLMRRAILDYPDRRLQTEYGGWVRIRDEGDKITLTYKQVRELSLHGVNEIELKIDSFDKAVQLFETIGFTNQSMQESKRETWTFGGCEIVLDEWPWLKPYVEIEGESGEVLIAVAKKLGFDWSAGLFGDVNVAYRAAYPGIKDNETIGTIPTIRFGDSLPEWLVHRQNSV